MSCNSELLMRIDGVVVCYPKKIKIKVSININRMIAKANNKLHQYPIILAIDVSKL